MVMNKSNKIAFIHANLCYTLATKHVWWLLRSAAPWEVYGRHGCQRFALSFHYTAPPCINHFSLQSTQSFLRLTNVSLKHRDVYFHCSILLYTFVVFQVVRV